MASLVGSEKLEGWFWKRVPAADSTDKDRYQRRKFFNGLRGSLYQRRWVSFDNKNMNLVYQSSKEKNISPRMIAAASIVSVSVESAAALSSKPREKGQPEGVPVLRLQCRGRKFTFFPILDPGEDGEGLLERWRSALLDCARRPPGSAEESTGRSRAYSGPADEWFEEGVKAEDHEQWEKAIMFFLRTVEMNGDNKDYLYHLAYCQQEAAPDAGSKEGQYNADALRNYQRVVQIDPSHHEAWYNLGYVQLELKDHDGALQSFHKALELQPNDKEALINLGNCYMEMKRYEDAVSSYEGAIKLEAGNGMSHYSLATAHHELAAKLEEDPNSTGATPHFEKAREEFRKAIELKPDHADAYFNLGICYQDEGKDAEARAMYAKAAELQPAMEEFHEAIDELDKTGGKAAPHHIHHGSTEPANASQWRAVHSAARWGKFDAVKQMVGTSNVDLQDPINGNYTIHIAAQNGHLSMVEFLVEKNVKVNVQNKTGQTALHMALEYDYYEIVLALIAAGADETIVNKLGCEARTGIEGKKLLPLVAFSAATNAKELQDSLKDLLAALDTDDRERMDKAVFVQTGMKHKKDIKKEWNADPLINTTFMDIARAL